MEIALERVLSDALEAKFEIGDVALDLARGQVVLRDVRLVTTGTQRELAGGRRLALDLDWRALVAGELEAESLTLTEPRVVVAYDAQGRLNWAGVGGAPEAEPSGDEEPAAAFRVGLARVEVGAGEVRLLDESRDGLPSLRLHVGALTLAELEIGRTEPGAPIHWSLGGADASQWTLGVSPDRVGGAEFAVAASAGPVEAGGSIPFELTLRREGGVELAVEGHIRPVPLVAELKLRWEGLRSRAVFPLLAVSGARVERGTSEGAFDLSLSLADGPGRGLTAAGRLAHRDLQLALDGEPHEPSFELEVAQLEAGLEELHVPIPAEPVESPPPVLVHWSHVRLQAPELDVALAAQHERPGAGDGAAAEDAPPAEEPGPPGIDLRVDRLVVEAGRVRVRDPSVEPPSERAFGVGAEAKALRWPELAFAPARLRLDGLGPEPLLLEGSWGPAAADVTLRAGRVDLVPWNPVIEQYTRYSVSRGELSAESDFRLRGRRYQADNRLTFHRLQAESEGDAFQKTFGMPLAVAIPLLSDPAGNLRLRVPVEGRVGESGRLDLGVAFREALREAIGNAISNTLATPVDVAGSVLRRIGEVFLLGVGEAAFAPGTSSLPIDAQVVVDSAAALVKRTKGARLVLVPQIVSDDFRALGVDLRDEGLMSSVKEFGRALFGGGRKVDRESAKPLAALASRRLDVVASRLEQSGGLRPARIVRRPWDGEARDGTPRVLLRLELH